MAGWQIWRENKQGCVCSECVFSPSHRHRCVSASCRGGKRRPCLAPRSQEGSLVQFPRHDDFLSGVFLFILPALRLRSSSLQTSSLLPTPPRHVPKHEANWDLCIGHTCECGLLVCLCSKPCTRRQMQRTTSHICGLLSFSVTLLITAGFSRPCTA